MRRGSTNRDTRAGAGAAGPIGDIHFRKPNTGPANVELITLESLYRRNLDPVLQRPQRLQFYAILLITHGRGVHVVDFVEHPYDDHTLFFLARGQVQQFRIDLASRGFLLVFTPDFLYQNSTESHVDQSMRVFDYSLHSPRWTLDEAARALFLGLFHDIQREYARPHDALSEEVLRHWVRLVLLHAERMRRAQRADLFPAPVYLQYLALRELVRREMAQSRSVQHYAKRLRATPRRLNQLTRLVLNKTAKAFIEEEVVHEAQRLLAQGSLSIKQVAYRMGFSEPTNWVKFFKKHTGESPAAFRRRFLP